jgi:hypothetical protein
MKYINQLFQDAKLLWSSKIDISDGKVIVETSGFESVNLNCAWAQAEKKSSGEDWNELCVWVIFKMLHREAKIKFQTKVYEVQASSLSLDDFKKTLLEALQVEGYEEMLKELNLNEML